MVSLFVSMVGGLLGVMQCLLLTLPLASIAWGFLALLPEWGHRRSFWVGFVAATSVIGFAWAALCANSLNTGRVEYALLITGTIAGIALGFLTMWLWRFQPPKRESP